MDQQSNTIRDSSRTRRTTCLSERLSLPTLAVLALCCSPAAVSGFSSTVAITSSRLGRCKFGSLAALGNSEIQSEVDRQLEQAKALLVKSKAKLAKQENGGSGGSAVNKNDDDMDLPFFASAASSTSSSGRTRDIIKSKDEETGLITADGEKMAALSEQEEWESRSLLEVFENEIDENEDVYSIASQQLASRDVAASIWNLRKTLQGQDYHKIFDKKNIFIQEE